MLTAGPTVETRMTHRPISVSAGASCHDIAAILAGNRIGAVPVLDEQGRLVGAVSELDLVQAGLRAPGDLAALTACEVMTSPVTVRPDMPLQTATRLLGAAGIRRLFVVADGRLVGVVSRGDLLRCYARHDAEIRDEVERVVRAALPDAVVVRAGVEDGVVLLVGRVQWRSDLAGVEPLVRTVPGVTAVRNRLGFVWDDRDRRNRR
ncbi:MAG TPA: CBS domain-containing protein [Actinophytocola sp.]|jgi:CBS domain-containing protein|uniref:CBS domain-containing protein n=1 Tax=Actinophytocola sp. TaxID=1872138 RepID=UPI002F92CF29